MKLFLTTVCKLLRSALLIIAAVLTASFMAGFMVMDFLHSHRNHG